MLVVDDRAWRKPHLVAQEIQPPAKFDVLVVGERLFILFAAIPEDGTIDQQRGTTPKEERLFGE